MRFEEFSFVSIRMDGVTYAHGVVIDRGVPTSRISVSKPLDSVRISR